ncbi:hypothetical protein H4R23_000400 [Coemansia sp. Cherry 401B]|nr:hypothetical protein H4R23_000400 [Coemansia sp. Cherry 401B]
MDTSYCVIAYILAIYAVYFIGRAVRRAVFTPLWKIPGPRLNAFTNLPFLFHTFCGRYHTYTIRLHEQYGEVVRVGYNQVSVCNVSELRRILATHKFRKSKHYERGLFLPPTIFSSTDPELNRTRRRQMGPTYSMATMRMLEDKVIESGAAALIGEWDRQLLGQKHALVNYFYGFHGAAVDIISVLGFGHSFGIIKNGDRRIIDGLHRHVAFVVMRSCFGLLGRYPWIAKPLLDGRQYVTQVAEEAIARRHAENEKTGGSKRVDILQRLIEAHNPATGQQVTGPHLTAEILLLLIAGTDTTSNTLSWTLMHLLHHPEVMQRLQQDIRQAFPDNSRPIGFDEARAQLPYLTAVFYESMRLHPAVSGYLPRAVPEEGAVLVDAYHLPAGTDICISLAACHRNVNIWHNPHQFNPERFMGPDAELRKRDVLVFSTGVRMCTGRNLAWIELYTMLANLLRKYNFELPENAQYGPHRIAPKDDAVCPQSIPGSAYTTFGPGNPSRNCQVKISLAA